MNTFELDISLHRRDLQALSPWRSSPARVPWSGTRNGKEYIDMGSGIAVTSFGVADEIWIAAVEKQIHSVQHMSNLFYTAPCANLAEAPVPEDRHVQGFLLQLRSRSQ